MFIKHVGKQGDRRVAIIFREVPGEDHMCLVVYPDVLPSHMHDALMKAIESPEAQQSDQLADAIHRALFPDGRPMLTALHAEGMLKKVQTETIIVTPAPNSSCKLNELNNILRQMKEGKQAIEKLAELDANSGITGKARVRDDFGRELRPPPQARTNLMGSNQGLSDDTIAENLRQQAEKMHREAQGLLAESARMMKEAAQMQGIPLETQATPPTTPKRGRPAKAKVADAAQG
jgi:hypothetical protein